jgi:hypothetical protein
MAAIPTGAVAVAGAVSVVAADAGVCSGLCMATLSLLCIIDM